MKTETQNKGLVVVREGRTELEAPYQNNKLIFIYNSLQKGNFVDVRDNLENQDLEMPNFSKTTALVYSAFQNPDNKYSNEIISLMKNNWFWTNTGILYTQKGVYIQDNPIIKNRGVVMNESDLIKKLKENDKSIRFVAYGFKIEEQTSLELSKNPFVIGLAGEEGTDKLAEIADKHKNKPYLWSFNKVDNPIQKVAALNSSWDRDGLDVSGDGRGSGYYNYAFGVLKKLNNSKGM